MQSQIFKKPVPIKILFDLLDTICLKTNKYYLIDENAYKKMVFNELHTKLCEELTEYYFLSKQFYINRKMSYNSFTNIIRQICKNNNVMFTSQIKYNESKYIIEYLIYF